MLAPLSRMPSRVRISTVGLLLVAACVGAAGCAHEPAFREALPNTIDLGGKAIAVIGDLQQTSSIARFVRRRENNAEAQQRIMADLTGRIDDVGALVVVGDLVFSARSARNWAHFDSLISPFAETMPVLPAIGNHDYPCYLVQFCRTSVIASGMRDRFPWFEPGRAYAVASGDLLLLFLDSESSLAEQGEWLGERLEAAVGRYAAALVFFHRPAFSHSIDRGAEGNVEVQAHVVPRLEAAGLPVVALSGHIHGFEYIVRNGVHYLTTAGGGGPRGPMGERGSDDRYRGPECRQPRDGETFRPFNYLLVEETSDRLHISVRGFCKDDPAVSVLDRIEIEL
jgi:hypothetical protein